MRDLMKLIRMEVFNCFEEKPTDTGGGGGGGELEPIKIDMGNGNITSLPAGTDLTDPLSSTDSETEKEEEQTGIIDEELLKDLPEGFAKQLAGKSVADILKDYANSQSYIGKLKTDLGKKQEQLDGGDKRTSEVVSSEINELSKTLKSKESELSELNEMVDGDYFVKLNDEVEKLKGQIGKLNDEAGDLKVDGLLNERYDKDFNTGFFKDQREAYKEAYGLDFEDKIWDAVSEKARLINGGGKVTPESMESAVMMTLGKERYTKILTTNGEQAMRLKLKEAGGKVIPQLDGDAGKGVLPLDYSQLSQPVREKIVNAFPGKQFIKEFEKKTGLDLTTL